MENGLGIPQTIALFGASSEIGQAVVRELMQIGVANVVLAVRDESNVAQFKNEIHGTYPGVNISVREFDANDFASHERLVTGIASELGDIDLAVVAFGVLGGEPCESLLPVDAVQVAQVNYTGTVSLLGALAGQMQRQNHGKIAFLSSVAGERVRRGNPVYGSSKAGADAFAQGLSDRLQGSGVSLLIVRPGFVASKMTAHLKPAPFATTPGAVAVATAKGLKGGKRIIWVPGLLRVVFSVFRHLPLPIWRKVAAKG